MTEMQFNKIFAAILIAGIVGSFSGFVAGIVIHPHELHEDAFPVEGVEVAGSGPRIEPKAEPILHLIETASIERGEKLSKACAACHTFNKGGANMVGPNQWDVVGNDIASTPGFAYSSAMDGKEGVWTYAELNKFLWKPKKAVKGTKMNFIGIKKPEDRAAMIAWLRTLADSPKPLPSQAEIEAEAVELAPDVPEDMPEEGTDNEVQNSSEASH